MALFRISPIVEEMQLLNGFAEERKRQVFRLNEELVALCANGQLSALQRRLQTTSRSELLNYFIADMFLKALESGHFAVCSYMVQQGYPLHSNDPSVKIPHAPFLAMNLVSDQRGRDMLEYLGRLEYDVNTPHDRDWLTLLHVAVRRQLVSTVEYLLARTNADVNAVAEDDVMPLTLALAAESSPMKDQITELLLAKGALATWRRKEETATSSNNMFSTGGGGMDSTQVSVVPQEGSRTGKVQLVRFSGGAC